jgi:chorismate mutase
MLDLKVENDQLTRQLNKLQQEISQKSELITRTDYDALKINILSLLNDRFKTEVAKLKEARP